MDKLLFKRILVSSLTALIVIYVIYLFVSANFNVLQTENATQMTVTDKIYSTGFIVRDEQYITNDKSGYIAYELKDGDDIEADGIVAKIYPNSTDAVARQKIEKIDQQISELNNLTKSYFTESVGLDTVNNQLDDQFLTFLGNLNRGKLPQADDNLLSLLYSINQRQLITGKVTDFSEKIAELESEKAKLSAQSNDSVGTVKTPKAGYFVSVTDGYEPVVSYKDAKNITAEQLEGIEAQAVPDNVIGKIVSELNWYVACPVTASEALSLSLYEDQDVTIEMPFASTEKIPAKIVQINQNDKDSDGVVVFQCNYMNTQLADARKESVEIGMQTYTGLRVSKKALHDGVVTKYTEQDDGSRKEEQKEVQGVYVVHGSELQFKEVSILYAGNDYVICDPNPEEELLFNGETVQLYDKVVIEGDKLYDGKIIS